MKSLILLAVLALSVPSVAQLGARPVAKGPTPTLQLDAASARDEALKALKIVGQRVSWDRKANTVVYAITFENTDRTRTLAASFTARTVLSQIPGKLAGRESARATHQLKIEAGKRVTVVGKLSFQVVQGYRVQLLLPDLAKNSHLIHRAALIEAAP